MLLDNAADPRYVETLPREGYRFIAPLHGVVKSETTFKGFVPDLELIPAHEPVADEVILADIVRPHTGHWPIASVSIVGVLALAAIVYWLLTRDSQVKVSGISPVTSYPGDEREPSLSPDGRQVAFSWNGEDSHRHIYVKLLGEQHPLRLTQDSADDSFPAWSPDGKQIAFMRGQTDSESDLMLIPSIGGPERILRRVQTGAFVSSSGRMIAWSPDGKWLCFTSELGPASRHHLFLFSIDSGNVHPLYPRLFTSSTTGGDSSPAFSPDGHWLAFARFTSPSTSHLFLQRLTGELQPARRTFVGP